MKRDAIRDEGLRELGVFGRLRKITVDHHGRARPYEERCRLFEEYKAELKKKHREISLECHPDRNLEASEEERERLGAKFNRLTRAINYILNDVKPKPPRRPAPQPVRKVAFASRAPSGIVVNMNGQPISINDLRFGTGTTASTGGGIWPWS